ncbi:MAG TPA: hypothetical protein VJU82_09845 [Acidobacteriaceae bacterium]|nr:hypothetical protein [Acidobacteriaceae bacterium]
MAAIEAFVAEHPKTAVVEDGGVLFEMGRAQYTLTDAHGRCTLHLWDDQRNIVRTISAATERSSGLRLITRRFGQTRPGSLELLADRERRTPVGRETARTRYLRLLERVLVRGAGMDWGDWKPERFRTAMDLEKSFGPAYARGSLTQGQHAWAVIGVNREEAPALVDGILTVGVLWLHECRENAGGKRLYRGLRIIVPKGMGTLTASRLAWMNQQAAQWELWELDERTEELQRRDPADHGNLTTRLVQAPDQAAVRERFHDSTRRVLALAPDVMRNQIEIRVRSAAEVAFLLHGLEFARIRGGYSGQSFNRIDEITVGAGEHETLLTSRNAGKLGELIAELFERRRATRSAGQGIGANRTRPLKEPAGGRDPLYRMQPERWLESVLRRDVAALDERLDPAHVYTQVPAFAASDRGMLDLLGVDLTGRLAVIELKADEDLHLALQGLDYWVRVRWHHMHSADATGLGEFQRYGYFTGLRLSAEAPRLYLVAPALRVHPATEIVLRYLSPRVQWELIALDERWREQVRIVWRKHSQSGRPAGIP